MKVAKKRSLKVGLRTAIRTQNVRKSFSYHGEKSHLWGTHATTIEQEVLFGKKRVSNLMVLIVHVYINLGTRLLSLQHLARENVLLEGRTFDYGMTLFVHEFSLLSHFTIS